MAVSKKKTTSKKKPAGKKRSTKKKVSKKKISAALKKKVASATNRRFIENADSKGLVPCNFKKYVPAEIKAECLRACHSAVALLIAQHQGQDVSNPLDQTSAFPDESMMDQSTGQEENFSQD